METIYAGTDEQFAGTLSSRLASLDIDHEYLVAKPKPEVEAKRTLHVVRVENGVWSQAVDVSGDVLEAVQARTRSEIDAAYQLAARQANKRGRLEVAAIGFMLAGALAGFLVYPYINRPAVCPWVPVTSAP